MENLISTDSPRSILHERYQILDLLGTGGSGKTYRAIDQPQQTAVAIKVLSLRGMADWKTLELFEREAKILAQLHHPAIPRYLDFFRAPVDGDDTFCLVQEIAPGRSLADWVAEGYIFSEKELRQIATQILEILIYLQTFTPPIIHRDIKPQNLLYTDSRMIYLVDFGAVRDTYHLTITGGSTIVGTYGYMAPEQFRGQALLATDLYGLGTTLLYLKSGQDPADLPVQQMKINFRNRVKTSVDFANWLDGLLEPIPEDRYCDAKLALDCLQGKAIAKRPRPKQPIAQVSQQGETMKIVIPPIWLATRSSKKTFFAAISLSLVVAFFSWLMLAAVLPTWMLIICVMIWLPLTPWMTGLLWQYCGAVMSWREIIIGDGYAVLKVKVAGILTNRYILPLEAIKTVYCQKVGMLSLNSGIKFVTADSRYYGGEFNYPDNYFFSAYAFGKYLDYPERLWLSEEIMEHLHHLNSDIEHPIIHDI
jgi:eukaryotic-like serine/threonine-protein kinase